MVVLTSFVKPAAETKIRVMWTPPRTTLLTISSALLVVAPKCPVCFLAYFGIFGVATASASVYRAWLPAVTAIWLVITVATLAFQRRGPRRQYGPALLGLVAALVLLSGKFILDNQALIVAGIVALLGAVIWPSWSRKPGPDEICPRCDELPILRDKKPT
jgi:drug/metabolite transporter (DMT)-like permease